MQYKDDEDYFAILKFKTINEFVDFIKEIQKEESDDFSIFAQRLKDKSLKEMKDKEI